uniref:ubiquitinyl hydrolase 1 n=2 Tax=Nothobranchius TaxID=28779 RepID=A0A8C6PBU6_NOTFU
MEVGSLVSCREDISALFPAETTPSAKYNDLSSQFCAVRKVSGDGNCFYRAACFAHLESALHHPRALQRSASHQCIIIIIRGGNNNHRVISFKDKIIQSGRVLTSAGFDESSFSHHQNTLVRVVEQCLADEQEDTLLRLFNEKLISDGVIQFLRLLTSAHLQNHADFFCNFVEAPDLKVYCCQEVETMAMECDHVDILALVQALDVGVHIVSMEGDKEQLAHHIIPEGVEPSVHLLYQTSHYNIIYQRIHRNPDQLRNTDSL